MEGGVGTTGAGMLKGMRKDRRRNAEHGLGLMNPPQIG